MHLAKANHCVVFFGMIRSCLLQITEYEESGGKTSFTALDYVAPTPEWAIFGSVQQGFDPTETRYHRKRGKKDIGGC